MVRISYETDECTGTSWAPVCTERLLHNNLYPQFLYFHLITSEQFAALVLTIKKTRFTTHWPQNFYLQIYLGGLNFPAIGCKSTAVKRIDHNWMHTHTTVTTNSRCFPIWIDHLGAFPGFSTFLSYLELNSILVYTSAAVWLRTVTESVLLLRVFR
jgi:hypothetical protein